MIGFDLLRSYRLLRYIPGMPRDFYDTPWFLSGQWLMQNHWNNVSNNFCSGPDKVGNGYTQEQVDGGCGAGPAVLQYSVMPPLPVESPVYARAGQRQYHAKPDRDAQCRGLRTAQSRLAALFAVVVA